MKRGMSSDETKPDPTAPRPLISELSNDAEMAELIEYFVGEMQNRIEVINQAWQSDNRALLQRLAHQLKGAAAGYGFPQITDAASLLEACLVAEEAELSSVQERVEALLDLCRRASAEHSNG